MKLLYKKKHNARISLKVNILSFREDNNLSNRSPNGENLLPMLPKS